MTMRWDKMLRPVRYEMIAKEILILNRITYPSPTTTHFIACILLRLPAATGSGYVGKATTVFDCSYPDWVYKMANFYTQ